MFWSDDSEKKPAFVVPDNIVDLAFQISCPTLPIDHAYVLSTAILQALPWLVDEEQAGIHLVHGASSGHGWTRPQDPGKEVLHLSRRTRLRLRLPRHRLEDAGELSGRTLDIDGHSMGIGKSSVHLLSAISTLFARYVVTREAIDEAEFLEQVAGELGGQGIPCRKMLCGIPHTHSFPDGPVFTRSLMVAELEPEQSVRLQQQGLGGGRKTGYGLFIPHKGIRPVKAEDDS
ncbi:MAG: type I-MYXAN CRISPR-associated protein Cas6/Cmx6 [Gammaproteobacteria bacterium]|nr:MAG: type I-MYXAN CRISPR-associated protein Cas6/Cmx6 [Gammaproteobacteria bacterium]